MLAKLYRSVLMPGYEPDRPRSSNAEVNFEKCRDKWN